MGVNNELKPIEELEFTDWQIERQDEIENVVYDCLLVLTEKTSEEFPWSMNHIGPVADMICDYLVAQGIPVRYPAMVYEPDEEHAYITNWHNDFRGDENDVE